MGKIEDAFESAWNKVIERYRKDWVTNLETEGRKALKWYPANFYSEADLESQLTCLLRQEYKKMEFYGQAIYCKNQISFSPDSFENDPKLSSRMRKLYQLVKEQTKKTRFIPDIAIETDSKADYSAFRIFAELKFWPDFMIRKPAKKIPAYFYKSLKDLKTQCRTLALSIDKRVCIKGYVCVISDGYVSHNGKKAEFEKLIKEYESEDFKFLVDGMSFEEELRHIKE